MKHACILMVDSFDDDLSDEESLNKLPNESLNYLIADEDTLEIAKMKYEKLLKKIGMKPYESKYMKVYYEVIQKKLLP